MKFDKVIGIDPGISGGIAVWTEKSCGTALMPSRKRNNGKGNETDVQELARILQEQKEDYVPIVFMERVQAWMSDQEDNPGKRFRIQRMLANYEALRTAIMMVNIPLIEVVPRTWQTYLALSVSGMEDRDRKNMFKNAAQKYYPIVKVTLQNADALLLVQFGRMKMSFDPDWVIKKLGIKENTGRLL